MSNNESFDLESIANETKKQSRTQIAKWFIAGAVALVVFALIGWWIYIKNEIIKELGGVPSGAVVAFDLPGDCPDGWTGFSDLAGRVIIGIGSGEGLTPRRYREHIGGVEKHELTVDEMPRHSHNYSAMIHNDNVDGVDSALPRSFEHRNGTLGTTAAGDGRPHNNMPPFLALNYCKKD